MDLKNFVEEFKLLKAFYVSELLGSIAGGLTGVVGLIYFLMIGFSPLQLSLLIVASTVSQLIFEIPTGAFADYFGRKLSVILSLIGTGIVLFLIPFFESFVPLFILFILSGLVYTFRSGADQAWFVDFIKHKRKVKIIQKALARLYSFNLIGAIPGGIISSIIMILTISQNFSSVFVIKLLWILSGVLVFMSALIYFFVGEESYFKRKKIKIKEAFESTFANSIKGLKFSIKHEVLFFLIFSSFLFFLAMVVVSIGWQQYMKQELNIHEMYFGFIGAFLSVAGVAALLYTERFVKKLKHEKYGLALLGIIIGLSTLVQSVTSSIIIGLAAFGILFVLFDFRNPIFQNYFNRFVPSKSRATVLSVNNMFTSIATLIGSLFFYGWITEFFGLRTAYIVCAFIIFISALIYLVIKSKK